MKQRHGCTPVYWDEFSDNAGGGGGEAKTWLHPRFTGTNSLVTRLGLEKSSLMPLLGLYVVEKKRVGAVIGRV